MSLPNLEVYRSHKSAVLPKKGTPYSVGLDLTAISLFKKLSDKTSLYNTGIKISCPKGYYAEILPRSSLSKTGYMLSNSVGVIDPDYTGDLLIALTKVDEKMPDIEIPFTKCQLILRKVEEFTISEKYSPPEDTQRGEGGFGSTDKK